MMDGTVIQLLKTKALNLWFIYGSFMVHHLYVCYLDIVSLLPVTWILFFTENKVVFQKGASHIFVFL